ncbi:hypothetical protein KIN20_018520 [Parelaphostrongylus tenuis]|uniref:Uncharacterized protein n=1 Tax=Parelaphostrongylus tenuis TaxID=148309 RepID=A0AAD5N4C0_PARTN|nr:hypothetical protein KIN20_018520 [Parelaphostrongylus tenuis]
MTKACASLLFINFLLHFVVCRDRSISVKGNLQCGEYPAGQILIRLWGQSERELNIDTELLGQTFSNGEGEFELVAQSKKDTDWTPLLNIYHDCDDVEKSGRRKLNFLLPKSYIEDSKTPNKTFDLGKFNLETHIKDNEERVEEITKRKRSHYSRRRKEVSRTRDETPPRNQSTIDRFAEPDDRNDPW